MSRQAAKASSRPATQQLRRSLGDQAIVEMDGTTGTVRVVGRLNGYLTRASSAKPAARWSMDYVSRPPGGARPDARTTSRRSTCPRLRRRRRHPPPVVDPVGRRDPVFGNGLQAAASTAPAGWS